VTKRWRLFALIAALAMVLVACPADDDNGNGAAQPGGASLLDTVTDRGHVVCGVNDAVAGFGFLTEAGEYEGFDIDFCRALAAAVFGDADAVEYVALTAEARFTALQAGEIDVLIRNTTWTATRDGAEGATFATTTFYDGQGMMVNADDPYESLEDMNNTSVCVLSGTTTESNLEAQFAARGLNYDPQTFEDNDTLRETFLAGACDGWTSDKSQLASFRAAWPEADGGPDALRILDVTMSKEPLGPATLDNDSRWSDAVNWTVLATIAAEEFGITSQNIDQHMDSDDPMVRRLLGVDGHDPGIGLPLDFAEQIIRQVGNYGEIYERNVGPNTPLGLERGENALWTDGGLLYSPPY
jgi:general L-amino acid transport system substrate-binding protein